MKLKDKEEFYEYIKEKNQKRKHHHKEMVMLYGRCSGMGNRYYKLPQKKVFRKRYFTR
ncbi:MAG: hypothetical protein H8E55_12685 [Pelagibacterales bacterium]|nr:hypothetical protein [Pelagibacterales bacterium]